MKRVVAAVSLALAAVFSANAMAGGVGVVDMQKVFGSAPELKKMQATLAKEFSGKRSDLMKMVKELQSEQKKLQRDQSVMKSAEVDKLKAKILTGQGKIQLAQSKYQKAVIAAQSKLMKGFLTKVKDSAKKVADKDHLDMVLVNTTVLYAKDSKDVTDQIVTDM